MPANSAHTPRPTEQLHRLPDAAAVRLLAARLHPDATDAVAGLGCRPTTVVEAAEARVRYLLLVLALDGTPVTCPDCAGDLTRGIPCAREYGALMAAVRSQADRAGRRLARLATSGALHDWD
ncbi:hypothetical protein SAMN05660690_1497 [Geodermatophilus telluris]|uniref:Uncharacterized protein n=1 Tax=Geodermatophilus telluris TaxID=1190417 RepID=A0A1G6LPV6_9ACTN|nr:hypothetical protein [Geodermatophilus telluris]SDC45302.1 hypothetical protein SAMN05660690_1497 [Geodermatophilus telluris]